MLVSSKSNSLTIFNSLKYSVTDAVKIYKNHCLIRRKTYEIFVRAAF